MQARRYGMEKMENCVYFETQNREAVCRSCFHRSTLLLKTSSSDTKTKINTEEFVTHALHRRHSHGNFRWSLFVHRRATNKTSQQRSIRIRVLRNFPADLPDRRADARFHKKRRKMLIVCVSVLLVDVFIEGNVSSKAFRWIEIWLHWNCKCTRVKLSFSCQLNEKCNEVHTSGKNY